MFKIKEQTNGSHIYMTLKLDNHRTEEIDVYLLPNGSTKYITSADHGEQTEEKKQLRDQIIDAFEKLY